MFYYYVVCIYLDFNLIHLSLHSHYPIRTEEKKKQKKKATDVKKSAAVEKSSRKLRNRTKMKPVDYDEDKKEEKKTAKQVYVPKKKEAEKNEEQPAQNRRSDRLRKQKDTKAKIESKQVAVVKGGGKGLPKKEEGGKYTFCFSVHVLVLFLSHHTFFLSLFKGLPMDVQGVNNPYWTNAMDDILCQRVATTAKHSGGKQYVSEGQTDWDTIAEGIPGTSGLDCKRR